jgi:hypothetical protein
VIIEATLHAYACGNTQNTLQQVGAASETCTRPGAAGQHDSLFLGRKTQNFVLEVQSWCKEGTTKQKKGQKMSPFLTVWTDEAGTTTELGAVRLVDLK